MYQSDFKTVNGSSHRPPPMDEAKARSNRERMSIGNLAPPIYKQQDRVEPGKPTDVPSHVTTSESQHGESRYHQSYLSVSEQEIKRASYVATGDHQRRDSGYASSYKSISQQPTYSPCFTVTSDHEDDDTMCSQSHRSIKARPMFTTQDVVTGECQTGALGSNPFVQPAQARSTHTPWLGQVVTQCHRRELPERLTINQPLSSQIPSLEGAGRLQPYTKSVHGETIAYPLVTYSSSSPPKSGPRKPRKKPEKPRGPQPAYSDEQRFYLMFARITLDLTWPEIMAEFAKLWGPRTRGGLTAMYYRTRDTWGMPEVLRAGEQGWNNDQQAIDARAPNFSTAFLRLIGYLK